jgi:hypothetical protein
MTSAIGVERSRDGRVRRRVRRHRRRLLTGLYPVTRELLLIAGGPLIFVFLFAFVGPGWAMLVSLLALTVIAVSTIDTSHREWHDHHVLDYNRQFRWFGRLLLALAVLFALGHSVPGEKYREWAALADSPKPGDCDWTTLPVGAKHCHYEPVFHHVNEPNEHITVEWLRFND